MYVSVYMCDCEHSIARKKKSIQFNYPYPYNGLMLHGKNATEITNWEAEGDNLRLSLSW